MDEETVVAYVPVDMCGFIRWCVENNALPAEPCYSDHDEDVRTKGSCDMCGGTERGEGDARI